MATELPKQYDPQAAEARWFPYWEAHGDFNADLNPNAYHYPYANHYPYPDGHAYSHQHTDPDQYPHAHQHADPNQHAGLFGVERGNTVG